MGAVMVSRPSEESEEVTESGLTSPAKGIWNISKEKGRE